MTAPHRLRVGVLASGRGSNLAAIFAALDRGELPVEVVLVAGNRPAAPALARAKARGVPVCAVGRTQSGSRAAQQKALLTALQRYQVELVVLAGYDQILIPEFIAAYPNRLLNIHPSLLPSFAGTLQAQAEALAHGVKITGCTAHFVTDEVDAGPIVLQAAVPVLDDDTVETLSARILEQEHRILPAAIRLVAEGRLRFDGRRVLGTTGVQSPI